MSRSWLTSFVIIATITRSMAQLSGGSIDIHTGGCSDDLLNMTRTILTLLQNLDHCCSNTAPVPTLDHPRDCAEILAAGVSTSGVYKIYPDGAGDPFFVSCDMETDGGGWTVFQRRKDGSIDFQLDWADFKYGFGSVGSEHWLGNDNIHRLSVQKAYELRVDLEDIDGNTRYASYDSFTVADESANYSLTLGAFSGNAGDSLSYHSGRPFTTRDRDNDARSSKNCAVQFTGAWWHGDCFYSNLNGQYLHGPTTEYAKGVVWKHWLGYYYSLQKTELKIRPV